MSPNLFFPMFSLAATPLVAGCASRSAASFEPGTPAAALSTSSDRPSMKGDAEKFTGDAEIGMLFAPNGPRTFSGAWVTFQPGARTAWHSHPAGQTLVVTEGMGWVQLEGEDRRALEPGDVMWTPPGVRHWHGATETTAMTHMALQGSVGDAVVDWGEHVTDAQYSGTATP